MLRGKWHDVEGKVTQKGKVIFKYTPLPTTITSIPIALPTLTDSISGNWASKVKMEKKGGASEKWRPLKPGPAGAFEPCILPRSSET